MKLGGIIGTVVGGTVGFFVGGPAGAAVGAGVGGGLGYTSDSVVESQYANKLQKQALQEQRQAIAKQEATALENRKQLINQQREQLSGNYNTYGTSTSGMSGVRGYLDSNTLG